MRVSLCEEKKKSERLVTENINLNQTLLSSTLNDDDQSIVSNHSYQPNEKNFQFEITLSELEESQVFIT